MDRTAFLRRTRAALAGVAGADLPASWPPTPASAPDAEPERFLATLHAVSGTGQLVDRDQLAHAVAQAVVAAGGRAPKVVVAPDVEPFATLVTAGLAEAGAERLTPAGGESWRAAAASAGVGITSARLGVAATGSVLIVSGADSPRAASILPQSHLVILPVDRLVAGLDEVMPVVASVANASSAPFLVTGPSRTSDIEMEMVLGVHGPKTLTVLLVR